MGKKVKLSLDELFDEALVKDEDRPCDIPPNWVWTKLSYISEIVTGGTPSKANMEYYGNEFPFIKPADLDQGRHVRYATEYLSESGKDVSRIVPIGSTCVCCIGTIGKTGYLEVEATTNQQINSIIPKINNLFIFYYCLSDIFQNDLKKLASATTISIVNKSKTASVVTPLPPQSEQQRIVDLIEALFEKLDRAKELAQNALKYFENRKSIILHKAISGDLTRTWRVKNTNFKWKNYKLNDVILEKPRNGHSPNGVPYITKYKNLTLSATTTGKFKSECFKYVNIDINDDSYLWLKNGDILIQRSNSIEYVGVCAIYDGADDEYIYPDLMMKVKANEEYVLNKYLYYVLTDARTRDYFRGNATGTAGNMPKINQKTVMNTPIVLPTISEQKEIVQILDNLFEKEEKAKELCDVIDKIDLMKKAILAKAFRGELGTNNPEEESALELLKEVLNENIVSK